jgi:hypothetical protein
MRKWSRSLTNYEVVVVSYNEEVVLVSYNEELVLVS